MHLSGGAGHPHHRAGGKADGCRGAGPPLARINILVSNIDQTTAVATAVGNNGSTQIKHAQKFTTGSNTSGYMLYDVKVFLGSTASSEPIVTVNTADGNNPDTLLYNLTAKDSSLTLDGPRRFTANAGATLEASTSYFIVAANGNTTNSTQARYNLYLTDSNAEDSTGLSDWSITDSGRTGNQNWSGTSGNRAFNIQVRGTVTPASDDATLSTLVLQDASDDSVLTLDPAFDPATLEYGATVGRGVDEITIIPTPNDTDADYETQDGDGTALTDADTTQDEFQVSIARGLNTIQVEVTAEDDTPPRPTRSRSPGPGYWSPAPDRPAAAPQKQGITTAPSTGTPRSSPPAATPPVTHSMRSESISVQTATPQHQSSQSTQEAATTPGRFSTP